MSKVEEVKCFECNEKYFESKMLTSFIDKHICYSCTTDEKTKQREEILPSVLDNKVNNKVNNKLNTNYIKLFLYKYTNIFNKK